MKSTTAAMETHLAGAVTRLAACLRIVRRDGTVLRFTGHDRDLTVAGEIYRSKPGLMRQAVANDASMAVDNLDFVAIIDDDDITEADLVGGKYDDAETFLFVVDWADPDAGMVKLRRARLGEVTPRPTGVWSGELRGMTQPVAQTTGELVQPLCLATVGDSRCRVPILPAIVERNTAYAVGDHVRATALLDGVVYPVFLLYAEDDLNDDALGAVATAGTQASRTTAQSAIGTGAVEFSPSGSVNPSQAFVSFPDRAEYALGDGDFTLDLFVRFKTLTGTIQTFASQYLNTGNQRAWYIRRNGANIEFGFTASGGAMTNVTRAATWAIDIFYHIAVCRAGADLRLFVDGIQAGATYDIGTSSIFDSTAPLLLGKQRAAGFDDLPLNGFVDHARLVHDALYTGSFTPPAAEFATRAGVLAGATTADFDDRIYRCTVAGATNAAVQPAYDTTIGETTIDGSASFIAVEGWTRAAFVNGVTDRRVFNLDVADSRAIDGWFENGVVLFETGANVGVAREVKSFTADTTGGEIALFDAFPFAVEPGDDCSIYPGCDLRRETCRDRFDNIINRRAFDWVPGLDAILRGPDAP